jgi:hypothetical protein
METEPLALSDVIEWHYKQTRKRDIEEYFTTFHIITAALLEGVRNAVNTLNKTVNGEE